MKVRTSKRQYDALFCCFGVFLKGILQSSTKNKDYSLRQKNSISFTKRYRDPLVYIAENQYDII